MNPTYEDDRARISLAREVADAMKLLAQAKAGSRRLSAEDLADLVTWAYRVNEACDALERLAWASQMGPALVKAMRENLTPGPSPERRGEQDRLAAVVREAYRKYPLLFAEHPELDEAQRLAFALEGNGNAQS